MCCDGDAGEEMTAAHEVSDKTVAVCLLWVVRLNLVERMLVAHTYLVLDQHFDLICQSAALELSTR